MKFCVYRQHNDSKMQQVLEYFETAKEAYLYAKAQKNTKHYTVIVGEFRAD